MLVALYYHRLSFLIVRAHAGSSWTFNKLILFLLCPLVNLWAFGDLNVILQYIENKCYQKKSKIGIIQLLTLIQVWAKFGPKIWI